MPRTRQPIDPSQPRTVKNASERIFHYFSLPYGVKLRKHRLGFVKAVDIFPSVASGFATVDSDFKNAQEATQALIAWVESSTPEALTALRQAVADAAAATVGEIVAVESDESDDESDDEA